MSINFVTLQGLTIPEGVVTQIADASGNILWSEGFDGTFKVKKITSNTYANDTTYENESFILLDIYPKTNGTVNVVYEGVTKTITDTSGAAEPNAQQVFFGTFNGVTDEADTPEKGIVTITGDLRGAGCGTFKTTKTSTAYPSCITAIGDWGNVEMIPDNAFRKCSLTRVTIPESVTSIGSYAFFYCDSLTRVTIPESVTSIGSHAFSCCSGLTSIAIPESVTSISENTFDTCMSLTSVTIPESVTSIGSYAFNKCSGLTSITIPESVISIGNYAFDTCSGLTSITIPESVTSIGVGMLNYCNAMVSIVVANGNTVYYSSGNCIIEKATQTLIAGCKNSVVPESVTSIGSYAFGRCTHLTSVTIPESVTSIGSYAFYKCSGLTSIIFDNTYGWWVSTSATATSGDAVDVTDSVNNVTLIVTTHVDKHWFRT